MRTHMLFDRRALSALLLALLLLGSVNRAQAQHSLVAWGVTDRSYNDYGQVSRTPTTGSYKAVAAGNAHNVAIRSDGSLVAWGYNGWGQVSGTPTTGSYIAVAAGNAHNVAIRSWGDDTYGTLVSWGSDSWGQVSNTPTTGSYFAVAAGGRHSVAIRSDGTLVSWGDDTYGQVSNTPPVDYPTGLFPWWPDLRFIAVAAGEYHSLALRSDGALFFWGRNASGQVFLTFTYSPLETPFIAIAAGYAHDVAIYPSLSDPFWSNGSLISWGDNSFGQVSNTPTTGKYIAVAAGTYHSVAIRSDGSLVAWGYNGWGQVSGTPTTGSYIAVAAGEYHNVAILNHPPVVNAGVVGLTPNANGVYEITIPHDGNPATNTVSLTLDGTASSDPDDDPLTYEWIDLGASVTIGTTPTVTSTLPSGDYAYLLSVTDPYGAKSGTFRVKIHVNAAPTVNSQSVSTDEDVPATITLRASDPDGDALTYQIVSPPQHGVLLGNGPSVYYVPDHDYNGTDSFTFKANDGKIDSDTATVNLTIRPVNDPPQAFSIAYITNEDTPIWLGLPASDPDGDALTYLIVSGPSHGILNGTDNSRLYTPDPNWNGTDSFTIQVFDGQAYSNVATVNIVVNPVNDPPVAVADNASTKKGTAVTIAVLANDSDADGDTLTVQSVTQPANGAVVKNANGTLTYTPKKASFVGTDTFQYTLSDGHGGTATATVTVTVTR